MIKATQGRPIARAGLWTSALGLSALSCGAEPQAPALRTIAAQDVPPAAAQVEGLPPIVLITVDTLRRDHLGCYGYHRDTSPNIDALADEGVLFEQALATSATTLPSHLSLLTGLYVHQHGRSSNGEGVRRPFVSSPGCSSVAKDLREAGYETAAFVSSGVLGEHTGMDDGFDVYQAPERKAQFLAKDVTSSALAWLGEKDRSASAFFLWAHYFDTHEPNRPPKRFLDRFATDEQVLSFIRERGIDPEAVASAYPSGNKTRGFFLPSEGALETQHMADLINRYDADLRFVDQQIGRLFEGLRKQGLWDRALIVFTADHSQSLGERGFLGHGRISDLNTFVPIIARFPGNVIEQPLRVSTLVSLVDVFPTLLGRFPPEFLGDFRKQLQGEDAFSGSFARSYALTHESILWHQADNSIVWCALRAGPWKYVYRSDEHDLFYNMQAQGELLDVSAQYPEQAAELRGVLEELLGNTREQVSGERATPQEEEEWLDALKQLGYAGD